MTAILPSGAPVNARGSMGDANHTPEICAERAAYFAATFKNGDIVRRDDGCHVLINSMTAPSCGGYVSAHGQHIDIHTGEVSGGWCSWATGSLGRCIIVPKPANLHDRPCIRQGC